jgi:hypothetical protein
VAGGDSFGKSLAAGDFNGDGYDDLAIGSPCEDGGGFRNSGAVNVIYGSEDGLTSAGNQYWHQDKPGIKGMREPGDFFGNTLAAGDFDDDDYDDLVVGVSAEDVGTRRNAGAVNVIYGSEDGLTSAGNQMWHQNKRGIRGGAERGDHFGRSLAVGDFNRDYYDDLVIGVPYENIGRKRDMGAMHVLYGSGLGLTDSEGYDEWWHPMQPWFVDTFALQPTIAESFAYALAAGDFNNDNCSDLAIGIPFWNSERYNDVGKVFVVYGHPLLGLQLNWRNFFSWPPLGTESAWVGYSLTTGDYNYDDYDDLVIGMPKADISGQENSGAVHVLWGSPTGLNYTDMQYRHQDSTDVEDQCEGGDLFGRSLAR